MTVVPARVIIKALAFLENGRDCHSLLLLAQRVRKMQPLARGLVSAPCAWLRPTASAGQGLWRGRAR